jgi:hypothetical protein
MVASNWMCMDLLSCKFLLYKVQTKNLFNAIFKQSIFYNLYVLNLDISEDRNFASSPVEIGNKMCYQVRLHNTGVFT